jgi:hypothetical protein
MATGNTSSLRGRERESRFSEHLAAVAILTSREKEKVYRGHNKA